MSPILTGVIASGISGNLTPPWSVEGDYVALYSYTVPAGGVAAISIGAIPQIYQHLQLKVFGANGQTGGFGSFMVTANGNDGVRRHEFWGTGGGGLGNGSAPNGFLTYFGSTTGFGLSVVDLYDYRSTTKLKVMKSLFGSNTSGGSGLCGQASSINTLTSPVTGIYLDSGTNFAEGTVVSLYGLR